MASKRVLLVGLGNHTHPQTWHSIGMLLLDHIASQLNITWSKNKSIHAYITQPTTIYVDPSFLSRSSSFKQCKLSKKKRAKKKEWDFGSESDEDIKTNINSTVQNDVFNSSDLLSEIDSSLLYDSSKHPSPLSSTSSELPDGTPSPKIQPTKSKPKLDPVPIEFTLLKPMFLMNVSGKSVSKAARELQFSHSNMIIIHDDMQRELGKFSIKNGGSANGHNGIKSLIDHLKTDAFQRLRIGIGRPPNDDRSRDTVSDFVLSRIPSNEMEIYKNDIFPKCKDELFKASINTK
ncbi:13689_t:CDS:2 [Funneliformis geosporum]|uniref:peptidyl-tRNA hydrolase n=1 Tax=Funneliformis geosporum TaxID=1117311 RepID=A0A9W4SFX3_9GLOM|nr:2471_t:CDS:2 [Funneliformis geosporum]CAI2168164.1 13689_t:CDS:2 [Funneliformis geosporum]